MEEEYFPRGKSSTKALVKDKTEESADKQASKEQDFLFGQPKRKHDDEGEKKKKKKVKKKGHQEDDDRKEKKETGALNYEIGAGVVEATDGRKGPPKLDNVLAFQNLRAGQLILGTIKNVYQDRLVVALPAGLSGAVARRDASDHPSFRRLEEDDAAPGGGGGELPDLRQYFAEGQPVRCAVLSAAKEHKRKQVRLSLRPALVNQGLTLDQLAPGSAGLVGSVASREDHGYTVDCGVPGVRAFLPAKGATGLSFRPGQLVEGVVKTAQKATGAVVLGCAPAAVAGVRTRGQLHFRGLKPGMLVDAVVDRHCRNGLTAAFLGLFSGGVSLDHLPRPLAQAEWPKLYRPGKPLLARIIFVDAAAKVVRLTLRPHLVARALPCGLPEPGGAPLAATVARVEPLLGLYLTAPLGEGARAAHAAMTAQPAWGRKKKKAKAAAEGEGEEEGGDPRDAAEGPPVAGVFVHVSKLRDGKRVEHIEKLYKPGQELAVRVTGADPFGGWALASAKESSLEAAAVTLGDLAPGSRHKAEVTAVGAASLTVALGEGFRGVVTDLHMADSRVKHPAKKFRVGQTLTVRVLTADPKSRRVYATHKKSLLADELAPLGSWAAAAEGTVARGFVSKVASFGLVVTFYGGVRGLVPAAALRRQGVESPEDSYRPGQVVTAVVTRQTLHPAPRLVLDLDAAGTRAAEAVKAQKKRRGSADADAVSEGKGEGAEKAKEEEEKEAVGEGKKEAAVSVAAAEGVEALLARFPGAVAGTVRKVARKGLGVVLATGEAAFLPAEHLADKAADGRALAALHRVGQELGGLLVLGVRDKGGALVLTAKPLLLEAGLRAGGGRGGARLPAAAAGLRPGDVVAGAVAEAAPFGLFLRFRGGLSGLVPAALAGGPGAGAAAAAAAEGKDLAAALGFAKGDAVLAAVQRVNAGGGAKQLVLTLRPQALPAGDTLYPGSLLAARAALAARPGRAPKGGEGGAPPPRALDLGGKLRLGRTVGAAVAMRRAYGTMLLAAGDVPVLAPPGHEGAAGGPAEGADVKVRLLDVDWEKRVFLGTLKEDLVAEGGAGKRKVTTGLEAAVTVELVRPEYLVVSFDGKLGHLPVADYPCPARRAVDAGAQGEDEEGEGEEEAAEGRPRYRVGQTVEAVVVYPGAKRKKGEAAGAEAPAAGFFVCRERAAVAAAGAALRRTAALQAEAEGAAQGARAALAAGEEGARRAEARRQVLSAARAAGLGAGAVLAGAAATRDAEWLDVGAAGGAPAVAGVARVRVRVHVTDAPAARGAATPSKKKRRKSSKGDAAQPAGHPFEAFPAGTKVEARVVQLKWIPPLEELWVCCALAGEGEGEGAVAAAAAEPHRTLREEVVPGKVLEGYVTAADAAGVDVALAPGIKGRVPAYELSADVEVQRAPAASFPPGARVRVLVCSGGGGAGHPALSLRGAAEGGGQGGGGAARYSRRHHGGAGAAAAAAAAGLRPGARVVGLVDAGQAAYRPPAAMVRVGPFLHGRLCATELAEPEEWEDDPMGQLAAAAAAGAPAAGGKRKRAGSAGDLAGGAAAAAEEGGGGGGRRLLVPGAPLLCRVLAVDKDGRVELTARPSKTAVDAPPVDGLAAAAGAAPLPAVGATARAYVTGVTKQGCFLRLARDIQARAMLKNLSDNFIPKPDKVFTIGKLVVGKVLSVDESRRMVELSLKPSDVISDGSTLKLEDLKEGLKVKGTVKKVKNYGVFVTIKGSNLTGLCHISEASDDFVENLESSFEEGDYVKAIVLKVEGKRISLGMKPSYFENDESSSSEEDGSGEESGEEGDDSDKEDKGVRPMDEDSSDEEDEVEALLNQARLKSMKSPKKKDSKEGSGDSEAEDDDDQDDSDSEDNGSEDEPAGRDKRKITKPAEESSDEEDEEEEEEEEDIAGAEAKDNKDDDDDDSDDSDDSDDEKVSSKLFGAKKPSLDIGFKWDDGESTGAKGGEGSSDEDSSDDDEEEGGGGKHSHKARQKAAERRREERALRAREAALADGEGRAAETDADHERLLVAEPNNALRWVQYMAFKLAAADADGARALAERALKTIAFRKEEERMNIWVALLNLEHKFGTPETLEQAFARAVQFNHPKRVHLRMAEIYGKSGAKEECEQLFQKAMKKFRSSKQVWMAYQEFRLRAGDGAGARALLPRALQSLAQHKHVPVVARFAHLEYDHGSAERGRTILEGLVGSYPKRLDLWNQYVDREIKQGNLPEARAVFERMISLSLSPHKMKNVFKKYLRFEMEHGDEEKAEEVKAKAQEYVRSLA